MSIELLIISNNDCRFVRSLLPMVSMLGSGISFNKTVLINSNGFKQVEHDYYLSRDDIDVVVDMRKDYLQWYGKIIDNYVQNISDSDYILFLHPDCFPITEGWGTVLYNKCKETDISGFAYINSMNDGIVLDASAFMINRNYFAENNISLDIKSLPLDFKRFEFKGYPIGIRCGNRDDILFDIGTPVCDNKLREGKNPFIMRYNKMFSLPYYFNHCRQGTGAINSGVHPLYGNDTRYYDREERKKIFQPLFDLYFSDMYQHFNLFEIVSEDDCPVLLKEDNFTRDFELEPF